MKLSEAIREGSKLRPQNFHGTYFWAEEDQVHSCAAAAAIEAVGEVNGNEYFKSGGHMPGLSDLFETCIDPSIFCPVEDCHTNQYGTADFDYAGSLIIHLNDYHRWTREDISDFVEKLGL